MRHRRSIRFAALAVALAVGPTALLTAVPVAAVTGAPAADQTHAFTARLDIGDTTRGCTGVLVDTEWLLTAASCFADDPAQSLSVPAGRPKLKTTATIGRTDLTTTAGAVREVVELVPRDDRDAVLARLDRPVTEVAPVALADSAPATGEELAFAGYGRTRTEWAPLKLHTGTYTVDASDATAATVTGKDGVSACAGDTGGPVLRASTGGAQLVALTSRSYQGGCFGVDAAETRTGGAAARVDDLGGWIAETTGAAAMTDFNCDGLRDVAISDPDATVAGAAKAGRVQVVYGGGKGTAEITQNTPNLPGDSEAGDLFGKALATFDHNQDGCTDLAVGIPGEAIGAEANAGGAQIVYGAPDGIATGTAAVALYQGAGSGALASSVSEAGDQLGASLAAGTTAAGAPYLAVGAPGEDSAGGLTDAGGVFYLGSTGLSNVVLHQDRLDVPGVMEADDKFGSAIAGSPQHLAIASGGEAIGTKANAGGVALFTHARNADNLPTGITGLDQDQDTVEGGAETGDRFGGALAMVSYRSSASADGTESVLAVGTPGEDGTSAADAGRVDTFLLTGTGATQMTGIYQGSPGVPGAVEAGDNFGATLAAVDTAPDEVSTARNTLLAVGVPGEDTPEGADAGTVYTFGLTGAPGDSVATVHPGKFGIPGTLGANQKVGSALTATGADLYLGMPFGPSTYGSVHTVPWANVYDAATQTVTTHEPGRNGLPATGDTFGTAIR
ncbi:S1 family peptidase [Streptomyces meridianus]|uniref:S1 family peptidase n=1 Tax=Streptomyces meridianus TaxID=2938945 RepID=A0ABT0X9N8_9ACTN|nr:S1 family peptidase [Streptomyces meridianus]MCM2579119.1 S1 family peptidase [Streptomyces meridianus]